MKKVRVVIVALISISIIVGFYYYLSHQAGQKTVENQTEVSEADAIIAKDLDNAYPQTPRSVVKFYNRIVSCLYNETYTDQQLEKMADQERVLMDKDLLDNNPREDFIKSLKKDVQSYKDAKRKIVNANVCESADVVMKTVNNQDCAYVTSSYFMKEDNSAYARTVQEFILRKDDSDNWKIIGFHLKEGDSSDD